MWFKNKFRKLLLCLVLEAGALMGMPIRPDEIEELMRMTSQPQIVQIARDDTDGAEDVTAQWTRE